MTNAQTFKIKGMHCASCVSIIEKTFKKVPGVESVQANYGTETAKVAFDSVKTNPEALSSQIEPLGYSLVMQTAESMRMSENEHAAHLGLSQSKKEKVAEIKDMRNKVFSVIPLAIFSVLGFRKRLNQALLQSFGLNCYLLCDFNLINTLAGAGIISPVFNF